MPFRLVGALEDGNGRWRGRGRRAYRARFDDEAALMTVRPRCGGCRSLSVVWRSGVSMSRPPSAKDVAAGNGHASGCIALRDEELCQMVVHNGDLDLLERCEHEPADC